MIGKEEIWDSQILYSMIQEGIFRDRCSLLFQEMFLVNLVCPCDDQYKPVSSGYFGQGTDDFYYQELHGTVRVEELKAVFIPVW